MQVSSSNYKIAAMLKNLVSIIQLYFLTTSAVCSHRNYGTLVASQCQKLSDEYLFGFYGGPEGLISGFIFSYVHHFGAFIIELHAITRDFQLCELGFVAHFFKTVTRIGLSMFSNSTHRCILSMRVCCDSSRALFLPLFAMFYGCKTPQNLVSRLSTRHVLRSNDSSTCSVETGNNTNYDLIFSTSSVTWQRNASLLDKHFFLVSRPNGTWP